MRMRSATLIRSRGADWHLPARPAPGDVRWYIEDVTGWYGGSGVRTQVTASIGHGDFLGVPTREGRAFTLQGAVVCSSVELRDETERMLSAVAWDGEEVDLRCDDGHRVLTSTVRLDGAPQIVEIGRTKLRFHIPLRSASPFLYADEQKIFLHPVGLGRGLEYPLFSKSGVLTYGTALAERDSITNSGDAAAYDSYLVVGDFPGGWRLTVGRKVIEWPWPTVLTAPVLVEMTGRIWIGDSNVTDRASVRQWAPLAAGATVTPSLTPLQGGTGWAEVRHRDTFI